MEFIVGREIDRKMELINRFMKLINRFKGDEYKKEDISDLRKYMEASYCITGDFNGSKREESKREESKIEESKMELDPRGKGLGAWAAVFSRYFPG